jgi:dTDP-4-amino-4,6-dideoxygalactose transaminase
VSNSSETKPSEAVSGLTTHRASPATGQPLHVGRPNIGERNDFMARVDDILDRRWFSNGGRYVEEFESRVAELLGVKHCVAICNATIALQIAIRALDLKGEVIVPSYTFVATAHALQWEEITPVFADMDPDTHNIDPAQIERLITPRTTGIIGVHVWGRPCDTDAIGEIAARRGLKVMYDAAHAFGCSRKGRMVGRSGSCEILSFHATKFINTFEGGAVLTDDDALAQKMRLMRNFGFSGYDNVIYLGTNGKMPEICAAMGLTSLEAMDELVEINLRNYRCYEQGLADLPGISVIRYDPQEKNNYHYIVVEVDPHSSRLNRDQLIAVLHAENVLARKYFWPGCHKMEPYRSLQPNASLMLPHTERVAARIMVLPTGQTVTPDDIAKVCGIIRSALETASLEEHPLLVASL